MPIRPIEIVKSQEVSQIKHMETQRAHHAQDEISKNFQSLIKRESSKPNEITKTENNEFRYDAKEKGNNQYYGSGGKKKEKEEEEKKKSDKSPKSGGFDILI